MIMSLLLLLLLLCYYVITTEAERRIHLHNHHAPTSDPEVHEMFLILGKSNGFSGMFRN